MPFLKVNSLVMSDEKFRSSTHNSSPAKPDVLITHNWRQRRQGFTLIELLIVISIIAVLIASATPSWQNAQMKSRDGKRKADAKAIQQALEIYLQKNGTYPQATPGQIQCNILGDNHAVAWGTEFACTPSGGSKIVYMQQLPKDPAYQDTAGYNYTGGNFAYILSTKLENTNDPENTTNPSYVPGTLLCAPQPPRNWCVTNP